MEPIPDSQLLPPRVLPAILTEAPVTYVDHSAMQATLSKNERITAQEHWQDVRLIELDLDEDTPLPAYKPSDVVSLMPENAPEDVECLLQRLAWTDQADTRLHLTNTDPCTLRFFYLHRSSSSTRSRQRKRTGKSDTPTAPDALPRPLLSTTTPLF